MIGEVGETQILATANFPQPLCHLRVPSHWTLLSDFKLNFTSAALKGGFADERAQTCGQFFIFHQLATSTTGQLQLCGKFQFRFWRAASLVGILAALADLYLPGSLTESLPL